MTGTGHLRVAGTNHRRGGNVNRQNAIVLGIAVFLGLIAVFIANSLFSGAEERQASVVKQARLTRIAVAAGPIDFGAPLNPVNVRMTDWPEGSVPPGAFRTMADATTQRVALQALMPGEPIVASRVSGKDGRATLATTLPTDKLAISIPINDVSGVSGFVRPGDAVDVLLTRQIPGDGARQDDKMTDVVMAAVPVLAIDQVFDRSKTDAASGKTATLQVDSFGAQKLALARELGTLSLALRNVASPTIDGYATVTARNLTNSRLYIGQRNTSSPAPAAAPAAMRLPPAATALSAPVRPVFSGPSMTVYRRGKPTDYEVLRGY